MGTRISEETGDKPKPMVLINKKPILWHLMNIFSTQGFNEFIISTGYKSEIIEDWVQTNEILDVNSNKMNISVINTGLYTQTGGRISEVMKLFPGESFMATYGDGLGNIPLKQLLNFHYAHENLATVTAVRPPARFGYMKIHDNYVTHFGEKNQSDEGWINGGFFVLNSNVKEYIKSVDEPFETGALVRLSLESKLVAFLHHGYWQPMDTLRERNLLEIESKSVTPAWLK